MGSEQKYSHRRSHAALMVRDREGKPLSGEKISLRLVKEDMNRRNWKDTGEGMKPAGRETPVNLT